MNSGKCLMKVSTDVSLTRSDEQIGLNNYSSNFSVRIKYISPSNIPVVRRREFFRLYFFNLYVLLFSFY